MIKCKLVRSQYRAGYDLFVYQEGPNGEIYPAKSVKLEFDTTQDMQFCGIAPTVQLPGKTEIDLDQSLNSETKNMLIQKEDDMERHIKSLEMIIDKLVGKL